MSDAGAALISIKPRYAEAILAGRKTVELRRRVPSLVAGTRLYIYSTLPVGAVVGVVTLADVVRGTPEAIWNEYSAQAEIGKNDYDAYFSGADEAVGLVLTNIQHVVPVTIAALRMLRPRFQPPQVLVRLTQDEASAIQHGNRVPGAGRAQLDALSLAS
jgi:predicted transcriptional regulator